MCTRINLLLTRRKTNRYFAKNDSFPVILAFELVSSKLLTQLIVTSVIIQLNLGFLWLSSFEQMDGTEQTDVQNRQTDSV